MLKGILACLVLMGSAAFWTLMLRETDRVKALFARLREDEIRTAEVKRKVRSIR